MKVSTGVMLIMMAAIVFCSCKKQAPSTGAAGGPANTGTGTSNVNYAPDYNFTHLQRHVEVTTNPNEIDRTHYLYSYNGSQVSMFVVYDSTFVLQGGVFVFDDLEIDSVIVNYTGNNVTSANVSGAGQTEVITFTYDAGNRMTAMSSGSSGAISYSYTSNVVTETTGNESTDYYFNAALDNYRGHNSNAVSASDTSGSITPTARCYSPMCLRTFSVGRQTISAGTILSRKLTQPAPPLIPTKPTARTAS